MRQCAEKFEKNAYKNPQKLFWIEGRKLKEIATETGYNEAYIRKLN
jgi:hypothetical protein